MGFDTRCIFAELSTQSNYIRELEYMVEGPLP